jgi:predicted nucleotidyltransferase
MIDEPTIAKTVELLRQAAPDATVILFGSYARGDATEDSDLDFLVVEPEVKDCFEEMVRLNDVLRPIEAPVDVLVTSQKDFDYWADTPGTVYYEAVAEGKAFEAPSRVR